VHVLGCRLDDECRVAYLERVEIGGGANGILGEGFGVVEVLLRNLLDFARNAL
jgi:hypothetical protein